MKYNYYTESKKSHGYGTKLQRNRSEIVKKTQKSVLVQGICFNAWNITITLNQNRVMNKNNSHEQKYHTKK